MARSCQDDVASVLWRLRASGKISLLSLKHGVLTLRNRGRALQLSGVFFIMKGTKGTEGTEDVDILFILGV